LLSSLLFDETEGLGASTQEGEEKLFGLASAYVIVTHIVFCGGHEATFLPAGVEDRSIRRLRSSLSSIDLNRSSRWPQGGKAHSFPCVSHGQDI